MNSPPAAAPNRDLLALHVAEAGLVRRRSGNSGLPTYSSFIAMTAPIDEDQPPSRRRSSSPGAGSRRSGRRCRSARTGITQDREHLEPVRERCRVLERVGGVGVEEAAAVGAQLLDPLLRGDRAVGDRLLRALERRDRLRAVPRLRDALPDEDERADDGDRQQDVQDAARQVDPEVADRLRASSRSRPRISATAIARPVAADVKLRTASMPAWMRWLAPVSPE